MSLNLAVILRESARRDPNRVAIILDSFKFTYAQLDTLSNQVASSLRAAGLKKGDRVGLMLPNVPQFPIAYFAILKAGAIAVPMNVLLKAPEVSYYMGDSGARYLIVWDDFANEAIKGLANLEPVTTYVALKPGGTETPVRWAVEATYEGSIRFEEHHLEDKETILPIIESLTRWVASALVQMADLPLAFLPPDAADGS